MLNLSDQVTIARMLKGLAGVRLYTGIRHGSRVIVQADGIAFGPERSFVLRNHSPDGFEWGYAGSGPAQLALALLLREGLADEAAERLYQQLKFEIVAQWNHKLGWLLRGSDLRYWIETKLWALREKQLMSDEGGENDEG